jgi:hypothetical protein
VYERELDGRVLNFGHAGMLYQNSFLMYDQQTESIWIQVTGEAFHGPLKGKKLKLMPSTVTTWEKWKERYPHSLVLPGRRSENFMGVYDGMATTRGLGLSVVVRFKAKLYPFEILAGRPVVNDRFNGVAVLVVYSSGARTATAWNRSLDGRLLRFSMAKAKDRFGNRLLRDRETGSVWSWLTGEAVSGPLRGRRLGQLSYNPILNDRFKAFYPKGPVYEGMRGGQGGGQKQSQN